MYSLALLVCALLCAATGAEVNEKCRHNLTRVDGHMSAYIGSTYTLHAPADSKGDVYSYSIGICVPPEDTQPDCAVVQHGSGNQTHCLGKLSSSQVARSKDGVWIELTYANGDRYTSHCGNLARTSRIAFLCDPNIGGKGSLDFLEENNQDDLCYYLFSLAARQVCGYQLSPGDWICIFLAVLVGVWAVAMVAGILYKRFMVGAKGWEQIPFISLYREFGNLEADGCDLVCRSRPRHPVEYKEPTFGADTDEEDEEKDDNLLPM